jgi:hypothetical protein
MFGWDRNQTLTYQPRRSSLKTLANKRAVDTRDWICGMDGPGRRLDRRIASTLGLSRNPWAFVQ